MIPSEEHKISMFPMDFEEFLWAIGDEVSAETIRYLIKNKKAAGNAMHRNLMRTFRLYMLVGGMPQSIETYIEKNNLQLVDETKREIVDLYEEDFVKIDGTGLAGDIYDAIPANLSGNASRYILSSAREGIRSEKVRKLIPDMLSSYTVNIAYHANNPDVGMSLEKAAGNAMHRNLMRTFRLYMLVGGMPQSIETYIEKNNLQLVDETKREIVDLYEEDFVKIDGTGLAGDIYDAIPANLSGNASRYILSSAREGIRSEKVRKLIPDMLSSYTVNIAYHANNPDVGMSLEKDAGRYKLFNSDVGLFITLAFKDKKYTENIIYNKLLSDKLDVNLGYVYENVVAQMLIAKGNNLFYYTMKSETSNHLYEIDFLTSVKDKICPLEVKSGNYRTHKSLDAFCNKFSNRIGSKYVVHTKDYKWENGIYYIPMYMVPFL